MSSPDGVFWLFVVRLLIVAGLVYRDDMEYQGILGKVFFPARRLPL